MTLTRIICAVVLALSVARTGAASEDAASLDHGYRLMYELDFESAARVFAEWRVGHPRDPIAPVSLAANLLFAELNRSGILQAQFFVDDKSFTDARHPPLPPDLRPRFDALIADAEAVARARLAEDPHDRDALFSLAMSFGLRADFAALLEGRTLVALSYSKQATRIARTLIQVAPDDADAYLAAGVGPYVVGSLVAPLRWVLRIAGFDGDKREGIRKVRVTAEHGRFLAPFARILLAIACLRDHDTKGARELLVGLARDFPTNPLFAHELQRIDAKVD
jgi:hypothetical protein